MTLIDSAATFEKRCNDIDDTGGLLNGLKDQDIKCFSALAFTIGTPQVAPTETQYEDLATKAFGRAPTLGQVSSLRRLHFEATTLIVATLNEQVKIQQTPVHLSKSCRQLRNRRGWRNNKSG